MLGGGRTKIKDGRDSSVGVGTMCTCEMQHGHDVELLAESMTLRRGGAHAMCMRRKLLVLTLGTYHSNPEARGVSSLKLGCHLE